MGRKMGLEFTSGLMVQSSKAGMLMIKNKDMENSEQQIISFSKVNGRTESAKEKAPYSLMVRSILESGITINSPPEHKFDIDSTLSL